MIFEAFMKELRNIPGLEELKPDKAGVYSLRINHIHYIYFAESSKHHALSLYAPLCEIPSDHLRKDSLYDLLMTANFFGQNSGNGWFASDHLSHQVFYLSNIPLELLSKDRFASELQQFISCLAHWKSKIHEVETMHLPRKFKEQSSYLKP